MNDSDLAAMSDEERRKYLSSLSLDELLKHVGRNTYNHVDGPAWKSLSDQQCHICHKPITDGASLRVKIGGSDCRPRIERELNRGPEMWEQISTDELEIIWTTFNMYGIYINDMAHKVKQVRRKSDLVFFELHGTNQVLVKAGSQQMILLNQKDACKVWEERT